MDWAVVEESWYERCEDKMTWFKPVEVIKEVADPKARPLLSKLIKALGEAETFDDVGDISGLLEEGENCWKTSPPARKAGEKPRRVTTTAYKLKTIIEGS